MQTLTNPAPAAKRNPFRRWTDDGIKIKVLHRIGRVAVGQLLTQQSYSTVGRWRNKYAIGTSVEWVLNELRRFRAEHKAREAERIGYYDVLGAVPNRTCLPSPVVHHPSTEPGQNLRPARVTAGFVGPPGAAHQTVSGPPGFHCSRTNISMKQPKLAPHEFKTCSMCNLSKQAKDFPPATNRSDGRQAWCRPCTKESSTKLRAKRIAAAELVEQITPLLNKLMANMAEANSLQAQIKSLIQAATT